MVTIFLIAAVAWAVLLWKVGTTKDRAETPADVTVTFTPQAFALLQMLANRQEKTISDTLRDALALQQYALNTREAGGKILVERGGFIQELLGS